MRKVFGITYSEAKKGQPRSWLVWGWGVCAFALGFLNIFSIFYLSSEQSSLQVMNQLRDIDFIIKSFDCYIGSIYTTWFVCLKARKFTWKTLCIVLSISAVGNAVTVSLRPPVRVDLMTC